MASHAQSYPPRNPALQPAQRSANFPSRVTLPTLPLSCSAVLAAPYQITQIDRRLDHPGHRVISNDRCGDAASRQSHDIIPSLQLTSDPGTKISRSWSGMTNAVEMRCVCACPEIELRAGLSPASWGLTRWGDWGTFRL
jgi:hypothetical protein